MSWFDKKSWRLRRKIRDLQADLKEAEREGKFIVEEGLFFAELDEMGDATMVVFGTTDRLASEDESVIRTFFDRNGFAIPNIKLDKAKAGLASIEIIPPEEMVKHVGRMLKAEGYRVVDDSESEREADLVKKVYPLSALVRSIAVLFVDHVQQVISTTRIKMNKEGNRLLHWMPKITEALQRKVSPEVVNVARPGFKQAYDHVFLSIGQREVSPSDQIRVPTNELSSGNRIPGLSFNDTPAPAEERPLSSSRMPHALGPDSSPTVEHGHPEAVSDLAKLVRRRDFAEMMMRIYRSLIRTKSTRCIHNAEFILHEVNEFYRAAATCIMVKTPHGKGLTIHAQAGKKLLWGEGTSGEGYPMSSKILAGCIKERKAVITDGAKDEPSSSMVSLGITSTAAVPVVQNNDIIAILYVDRRGAVQGFSAEDAAEMAEVAFVFEEFPDLLLGLPQ